MATKYVSEEERALQKKRKKSIITGIILIGIVLAGTFGFNGLMRVVLKNDSPIVVVTSGSMEPEISRGDLLIIRYRTPEEITNGTIDGKEGDIILYDTHGVWANPIEEEVVHRVVGKYYNDTEGMWYFYTKGDANDFVDPPSSVFVQSPVPEGKITGVVLFKIPWVGNIKLYLDESKLTIPLIVILGLALVISIVWDITHPEEDEKDEKTRKKN